MRQHNGTIVIGTIENAGDNAHKIGQLTARFVHYADSQQLIVWLPEYGKNDYGNYHIVESSTGDTIEKGAIGDKLNGSVQLVWESQGWLPGTYRLEIEHPKGGQHVLYFQKMADDPDQQPISLIDEQTIQHEQPIIYRDAYDNIVVDEDIEIRNNLSKQLATNFETIVNSSNENAPRLEYEGNFRGGSVIYVQGPTRLRFWHEMGGGDCKAYITIPAEQDWEVATKTPLTERRNILLFIASTVQRAQAPNWRFEIRDREIAFFGSS
jgi:hypothetical protein